MSNSKEAKKRYFKKIYDAAEMVECACGCKKLIKNKDKYGRDKKFISGHNNRKYEDPTQHKREWNHRNRRQIYLKKVLSTKKRKKWFIDKKGNKCLNCGLEYNGENGCCFDFHHRDPAEKSFGINLAKICYYSLEKTLKELTKCDLLCAVCHRTYHSSKY